MCEVKKNICGVELNKPMECQVFYLRFSHDGNGKLEFRVHFLGKTDLRVNFVEVGDVISFDDKI